MLKIVVAAPATDMGAISYLFENLDLVLKNKDKILSCEQYNNIQISGFFVGGLYVGMHKISIGNLLNLWDNTIWHTEEKYYFNIIGTPLSGQNTAYWYNTKNNKIESGMYNGKQLDFLELARPALTYLNQHSQKIQESNLSIYDLVKQLQR